MTIPQELTEKVSQEFGISPELLQAVEERNELAASLAASIGIDNKELAPDVDMQKEVSQLRNEFEQLGAQITGLRNELADVIKAINTSFLTQALATKELSERLDKQREEEIEKTKAAIALTPQASLISLFNAGAESVIGKSQTEVDGRSLLARSSPAQAESSSQLFFQKWSNGG